MYEWTYGPLSEDQEEAAMEALTNIFSKKDRYVSINFMYFTKVIIHNTVYKYNLL